jgi:hypothetical protein
MVALFTFVGLAEDQSVAVLAARMVGRLPLGINDRPFSNLDNAITGLEARSLSCLDQFDVRPLITVVMNVIGDLAEKDPFWLEDPVGFLDERRIRVGKRVSKLFWRPGP